MFSSSSPKRIAVVEMLFCLGPLLEPYVDPMPCFRSFTTIKIALTITLFVQAGFTPTAQTQVVPDLVATPNPSAPLIQGLRDIGWIAPAKQAWQISGTLTRTQGSNSSDTPIRIWASGPSRIRVELDTSSGMASLVLKDGGGKRTPAGKSPVMVSRQSVAAAHQWMLPWLALGPLLDSALGVKTRSGTINGVLATGYDIQGPPIRNRSSVDLQNNPYDRSITLWLSAKGIPLQIDYILPSDDNPYAGVLVSRQYKDFQLTDGVLLPQTEEEYLGDQMMSRLRFGAISAPSDLSDTTFTIPTAGRLK